MAHHNGAFALFICKNIISPCVICRNHIVRLSHIFVKRHILSGGFFVQNAHRLFLKMLHLTHYTRYDIINR